MLRYVPGEDYVTDAVAVPVEGENELVCFVVIELHTPAPFNNRTLSLPESCIGFVRRIAAHAILQILVAV